MSKQKKIQSYDLGERLDLYDVGRDILVISSNKQTLFSYLIHFYYFNFNSIKTLFSRLFKKYMFPQFYKGSDIVILKDSLYKFIYYIILNPCKDLLNDFFLKKNQLQTSINIYILIYFMNTKKIIVVKNDFVH